MQPRSSFALSLSLSFHFLLPVVTMTLFATFRIAALRLWDHLWWFFTGSLWVARTVRAPIGSPMTSAFTPLTDDCLLLLLSHFSVSELFLLRGVCRHLCHLIERYHFRKCKTLLTRHDQELQRGLSFSQLTMQVTFTTTQHLYSDYCRQTGVANDDQRYFPTLQWPLLTRRHAHAWQAFPLSLPLLLPNLSSLTWTHSLADSQLRANTPGWAVNRLLLAYLNSSWSTSLLSLHLHIEMSNHPKVNLTYFQQLNQLTNLKHLFLEFSKFFPSSVFLPEHMHIFGQLHSFSLHNYGNSNIAKLLSQLGPNLNFLSLFKVSCPLDEFVNFLHARPTYGRTLQTVELLLYNTDDWKLFATITQCLFSLERLFCFVTSPQVSH